MAKPLGTRISSLANSLDSTYALVPKRSLVSCGSPSGTQAGVSELKSKDFVAARAMLQGLETQSRDPITRKAVLEHYVTHLINRETSGVAHGSGSIRWHEQTGYKPVVCIDTEL